LVVVVQQEAQTQLTEQQELLLQLQDQILLAEQLQQQVVDMEQHKAMQAVQVHQAEVAALTVRLQAEQEIHHQHHQVKVSLVDQVLIPTVFVEQVVVVAQVEPVLTDPQ
jgi:hypothetical protein